MKYINLLKVVFLLLDDFLDVEILHKGSHMDFYNLNQQPNLYEFYLVSCDI